MKNSILTTSLSFMMAMYFSSNTYANTNTNDQTSLIKANSQATIKAIGLTKIGAEANKETYDLATNIGDTWRLTIDTVANSYQIVPNKSFHQLTPESGELKLSKAGNFIIYNFELSGKKGSLVLDTQTQTISGNLNIGGKSATVVGSPYQVGNMSALAGFYNFLASKSPIMGFSGGSFVGQFKINDDGETGFFCQEGRIFGSGCQPFDINLPPFKKELRISKDVSTGIISMILDDVPVASVFVQAGDRGPVWVASALKENTDPTQAGYFFATKIHLLQGDEFNGTWSCSNMGATHRGYQNMGDNDLNVTNKVNSTNANKKWREIMAVNYVPSTFKKISEFPGIAATANPDQADPELKSSDPSSPLFEFSTVFPLSSSLAVIQISTLNSLSVCTRLD